MIFFLLDGRCRTWADLAQDFLSLVEASRHGREAGLVFKGIKCLRRAPPALCCLPTFRSKVWIIWKSFGRTYWTESLPEKICFILSRRKISKTASQDRPRWSRLFKTQFGVSVTPSELPGDANGLASKSFEQITLWFTQHPKTSVHIHRLDGCSSPAWMWRTRLRKELRFMTAVITWPSGPLSESTLIQQNDIFS